VVNKKICVGIQSMEGGEFFINKLMVDNERILFLRVEFFCGFGKRFY
jgi:hypothetical protein